LAEDEEHLFTFYAFPAAMHRHIQTTNAIESLWSLVRQRTDQIDVLYFGDQLPEHCLGHDPGYPLAPASRWNEAHELSRADEEATDHEGGFRRRCLFVPILACFQHGLRFFCSHGVVSGEHVSCASYEMARTCDIGVRISQMDRRSFMTHQVVFVQPVLSLQELFLL